MLTTSLKMIPRTLRSVQPVARASIMPVMRAQAMRTPIATPSLSRSYASGGGLSKDEIKTRVEDVLKSFEKVDPSKVNAEASFTGDLGLDSLDAVEVVMAIEEEFNIEIPDTEADNITTVQQAISYIEHTPDGTSNFSLIQRYKAKHLDAFWR